VIVSTPDNIPGGHIRLDGAVHDHKTPMEKTTTKVAEEVTLSVLA
jgi:hypothetical protein